MSTSVEFLKFTASDAYKADPSILNETAELVAQAPGAIQCVLSQLSAASTG